MFILKELIIENFLSFVRAHTKFKNGLYSITGYDQTGGDSNGSGKSTLLSAICFALFGRTQNGLRGNDVVRWGALPEHCKVVLGLIDENNQTYIITRGPKTTRFLINGEEIKGHKIDIQESINKAFKTDFNIFTSSTCFNRNYADFLAESGDAARKKLFKSILMLDKIDKAYETAKAAYSTRSQQADTFVATLSIMNNSLTSLREDKIKYKAALENETLNIEKNISELETQREQLKPKYPNVQGRKEPLLKEKEGLDQLALTESIQYLNPQLSSLQAEIAIMENSLVNLYNNLKTAETLGADCPTCGSKLTRKNLGAHKSHIKNTISETKGNLYKAKEELTSLSEKRYDIETMLKKIEDIETQLKVLDLEQYRYGDEVKVYNEQCEWINNKIKELRTNPPTYKTVLQNTIEKINIETEAFANLEQQLEVIKKELDIYAYLKWLYSRQGVINVIIEKAFARLQLLANNFLSRFCKEKFQVEISPQKELKSGTLKDETDVYIKKGDKKILYTQLSSGQQQRINIALLIAVYIWSHELRANMFDFLLLDEVLDLSLAAKGQEDVLDFIADLRNKISTILLITHKDTLSQIFDHNIHVGRDKEGVSTI